ncbi:MAG: 4-(cytidine 5'-diphospho)-2-C-methyl-D-erythritol kinase [Acidobacteriota bacterium]|nr:4-(cytidine 5'-diphospho)-2-C-methyl-D-erythritol kinase [Acidobacteriota bacterium]
MSTCVRSYSKINLGLAIGPARPDGFHGLTTLYQTLALHDLVTLSAHRAQHTRITLTTNHPHVPRDQRNTVWRIVERCLSRLGIAADVQIHIQKSLPVQGGLGAGSANAAAALLGLERELGVSLAGIERLHLAAEVGSDVPLFLLGGAVVGRGRGEQVLPLPDLPRTHCIVAVPALGVSTPAAFRDWDALQLSQSLTSSPQVDRLLELSLAYSSLSARSGESLKRKKDGNKSGTSGIVRDLAPGSNGEPPREDRVNSLNDLAENTLLALVRTGIGNDFEQVVFPQYPSLRITKRQLMGSDSDSPAVYAALSGSGSALFGLYRSEADAKAAQQRVHSSDSGVRTFLTETLPRDEYWNTMFAE